MSAPGCPATHDEVAAEVTRLVDAGQHTAAWDLVVATTRASQAATAAFERATRTRPQPVRIGVRS